MFNIILASHGNMAEGMLDSAKLFYGNKIKKIKALCIKAEDNPAQFYNNIIATIEDLGKEDGTLIFVDLFGGTPSNRSAMLLRDPEIAKKIKIITGMNFTMLLEVLSMRENVETINQIDFDALIETGKDGIKYINKILGL